MTMTDTITSTTATHNEDNRSTRSYGYVGYCHLGKARVWSMSLEDCETQAKEFARSRPRHVTRKGVFIYKLAEEKELIKVLTLCNQ